MLPETGVCFDGVVSRVIDGDTLVVSKVTHVVVRLRDCWAAESHRTHRHDSEKSLGLLSAEHLRSIAEGRQCRVHVQTDGDEDMGDGVTFGRLVGDVYDIETEQDYAAQQIISGHAFESKAALHDYLTKKDLER